MKNQHIPKVISPKNNGKFKNAYLLQVESLFSCYQCDYDTDTIDGLNKHYFNNIHNVHNQNKTLEDVFDTIQV